MVIKRVFEIEDKNYNEKIELSGKHGFLKKDNIILIDIDEIAQSCIENVTEMQQDIYVVDSDLLNENITSFIKDIQHILEKETLETALSTIYDDEEIKLE